MPSYEIIINRDYNDFTKVWNECKRPLYRHSRDYMEQQQKPLKVRIGVNFTFYRPKTILELDEHINFLNDEEIEKFLKDIKSEPGFNYHIARNSYNRETRTIDEMGDWNILSYEPKIFLKNDYHNIFHTQRC